MMKSPFKSNHLESQSPRTERLDELAVILARGILRLREKLAKSAADPLDVFDETRLTVSPRLRKLESPSEKLDVNHQNGTNQKHPQRPSAD